MQRKKLLVISIALALQTACCPAFAGENTDKDDECPSDIASLSQAEQKKLPAICVLAQTEKNNHWGWAAGGIAALAAGVALGVHNNDHDGSSHHYNPAPPIPDDDDDILPPTPPDDDDDVNPPTPPDDDDDVIPPDDGGDDDVIPPDASVITFSNGVTLDKGKGTLHFDNIKLADGTRLGAATLRYLKENDRWQLTTADGKTLDVSGWKVTDKNAAVIEGTQSNGLYWKYDSRGYLILADKDTRVIDEDGTRYTYDTTGTINGNGKTGLIISGDGTSSTLNGGSTVVDGATGIVISGDGSTATMNGDTTVDNANGGLISGNDTTINTTGKITVTGGGTAMIIDGDNIELNNTGISDISGKGSTSTIINGNGARIINDGEMTITEGATGGIINGNDASIDNKGDSSVSGEGSTALIINGDGATITNEGTQKISDGATGITITGDNAASSMFGDTTVSGGGTGTKITGDGAVIDNTGNITSDGKDSTALYIDGDNALIISEGSQTITNGASGTYVNGDNARIFNIGDISADGEGSSALVIDSNNSRLAQAGDLLVTNGAQGIVINGKNNSISNTGDATVYDENSIGFLAAGTHNTLNNKGDIDVSLNGTGALVSGDEAQVTLDGNINVTAKQDSSDMFHGATGVKVEGSNSTTNILGDITLTSDFKNHAPLSGESLTGINITGDNNQVTLSGSLNIGVDDFSEINPDGHRLDSVGINIEGDGNNVNLEGGINLTLNGDPNDDTSHITGVEVAGDSRVTLSGHSQIEITGIIGAPATLAHVKSGGEMVLDKNSTVDVTSTLLTSMYYNLYALLMAEGEGSTINNQGIIDAQGITTLIQVQDGAEAINSGDITATSNKDYSRGVSIFVGNGSTARNTAGGNITLVSSVAPVYRGTGIVTYPHAWYENTAYGMLAYDNGSVFNDAGGSISVYGAGLYAMATSNGTATNAGNIYVDGFRQRLDADGNITGEAYWSPSASVLPSAGMTAGVDSGSNNDASVINTGTITVHNAGYGMTAMYGGTAINQGTINLTADENISGQPNQLVGMAAFGDGKVINDTTGIININADYGQPFYAEDNSLIINYGTICMMGNCQDSATYNPTDNYVNPAYSNETLAHTGETITLAKSAVIEGEVTNDGTVTGQQLLVQDSDSTLTNSTSGVINSDIVIDDGTVNNKGSVNKITLNNSGTFNNEGTVNKHVVTNGGTFNNLDKGQVLRGAQLNNNSVVNNSGTWTLGYANEGAYNGTLDINGNAVFNNSGEFIIDNSANNVNFRDNSKLYNTGHITITDAIDGTGIAVQNGTGAFINAGVVDATSRSVMASAANAGSSDAFFWNQEDGIVNYDVDNGKAINFTHSNYIAENDGTMNISGNNAYGMYGSKNAQLINNGTINLGSEGTTDTGMVAMALDANATTDAVIENNGTINIHASDSYAFSVADAGHVVNNGTVVIDADVTGSGLIKQGDTVNVEGTNGNNGNNSEVHYTDYTLPDATSTVANPETSSSSDMNNLSGYVVGTNADGSAGQLKVSNASMDGVGINTGFTAGTADTTVTFNNVVEGSNLTDASAIQSTSVVWNAQGRTDSDGNVDVTMTKNAYTDVATDSSVSDIAQALDASYTNNELFTSLNVSNTAEMNSALKQVSGSQATAVFRETHVLSNRFNMLADAAPQINNGLAFNLVAKGDPRTELGNDTQYDMLALRQKLVLSSSQNLTMEYGIARLNGSGSQKAGDNGVTGGYSQFFGLKHAMGFDNGLIWNNALRYDVHNLDSSRSVSYGDVSKVANSDARQQYLELRSEGMKTFKLDEGLVVTPYAGFKLRHTLEDGYKERNAGDFNLSMNSGTETAVDSIVGLKLDYTGKNGWSANMTLEGGPNLSYAKSQRTASLQGAAGQSFSVNDDQKGGGINGVATVGVKYSSNDTALHLDAYHWKEDSISDRGFMLNVKKTFR
ncbi:autotransporter adhesin BigA [Enterobacter cancerogenus]|uniref:BigA/YdbA N-terminal beta-barrel domain-containing protein n=1 Tax=Enterobacter cancerogenus TaxID=69218 RepID=UPI0030765792